MALLPQMMQRETAYWVSQGMTFTAAVRRAYAYWTCHGNNDYDTVTLVYHRTRVDQRTVRIVAASPEDPGETPELAERVALRYFNFLLLEQQARDEVLPERFGPRVTYGSHLEGRWCGRWDQLDWEDMTMTYGVDSPFSSEASESGDEYSAGATPTGTPSTQDLADDVTEAMSVVGTEWTYTPSPTNSPSRRLRILNSLFRPQPQGTHGMFFCFSCGTRHSMDSYRDHYASPLHYENQADFMSTWVAIRCYSRKMVSTVDRASDHIVTRLAEHNDLTPISVADLALGTDDMMLALTVSRLASLFGGLPTFVSHHQLTGWRISLTAEVVLGLPRRLAVAVSYADVGAALSNIVEGVGQAMGGQLYYTVALALAAGVSGGPAASASSGA